MAESVFIAAMFVKYGEQYAQLCRRRELDAEATEMDETVASMVRAVETHGWDGEWFRRAYDAMGQPVGSRLCKEGQMFVEPQGFCVMAGIGLDDGESRHGAGCCE